MYRREADGTIVDSDGKIIYFSLERFINDICIGNKCFICGIDPSEAEFNDEHAIPKWLLRKHDLFDKWLELPNKTSIRYGSLVVPCCKNCNSKMGDVFEKPIENLFAKLQSDPTFVLTLDDLYKLFIWFNLVFLKVHLKDKQLPLDRKNPNNADRIFDIYDWSKLHHIHCIARSLYTKAVLGPHSLGSFLLLRVKNTYGNYHFKYADHPLARTLLIRSNNLAFCIGLLDSGMGVNYLQKQFPNFNQLQGCSQIQTLEIYTRLSFINMILKYAPIYVDDRISPKGEYKLVTYMPDFIDFEDFKIEDLGEMLSNICSPYIPLEIANYGELSNNVKSGNYTFLFDESGKFITNSI